MAVLERYFSPLLHYISRVVLNREIAKKIVMDAVIGLVIAVFAVAIVSFISGAIH